MPDTEIKSKIAYVLIIVFMLAGCAKRGIETYPTGRAMPLKGNLTLIDFTIQAGAFARADNAARLTESLQAKGLAATHFKAKEGLYKVRFGNFPTRGQAIKQAEALISAGIISEFYIVSPKENTAVQSQRLGSDYLRAEIIKTAKGFLGVPYLWGGATAESGFDCSGFIVAVYQLNGLRMPRSSLEQFSAGRPIARREIHPGDLVFFATRKRNMVSHVGIYVGNNQFIHAPAQGKNIRLDSMYNRYYKLRYLGARSYL